ncbi:pseudouridine synthase [Marinicellulosiphila megalodicopiae]|uniref:pseudouridine synthase n=1 Tax=Marinicellulosiphila megalodicopiae TaxID=2724896 RepID=UPI003BAE82E2
MTNNLPVIVFEDDDFVVMDKPSGLLVHPSWLSKNDDDFAVDQMKRYLNVDKIHNVHRLDRPTCGLLLFAKHVDAAQKIGLMFEQNLIEKNYIAICRGWAPSSGEIDYALKPEHDKIANKFSNPVKEAQDALTHFTCLKQSQIEIELNGHPTGRFSFVSIRPKTGRKHQIRRHFKHIHHPLLGDTRHGCNKTNRTLKDRLNWSRLALRANKMQFLHPYSQHLISIEAPRSIEFDFMLNQLDLL